MGIKHVEIDFDVVLRSTTVGDPLCCRTGFRYEEPADRIRRTIQWQGPHGLEPGRQSWGFLEGAGWIVGEQWQRPELNHRKELQELRALDGLEDPQERRQRGLSSRRPTSADLGQ